MKAWYTSPRRGLPHHDLFGGAAPRVDYVETAAATRPNTIAERRAQIEFGLDRQNHRNSSKGAVAFKRQGNWRLPSQGNRFKAHQQQKIVV